VRSPDRKRFLASCWVIVDFALPDVALQCPLDLLPVESAMAHEPGILGRHDGALEVLRDPAI
jgi:hypothetical protein